MKATETTKIINGKTFYNPYYDSTKAIDWMHYCNNGFSYGYSEFEEAFFLCGSPILSAVILHIINRYDTFDEMRDAFFKEKEKLS